MDNQELLFSNLVELAKATTFLNGMKNYLDKLYQKIEVDDPGKKDQLFATLWQLHNSTADAIDLIKQNTENLLIINQRVKSELN